MKNKYSESNQLRLGDYVTFCDICGCKCWMSDARILSTYTGRGGMLVCPDDYDCIDYGIVPYKIRAEQPVPIARDTVYSANPAIFATSPTLEPNVPLDIDTQDPLNTPPTGAA